MRKFVYLMMLAVTAAACHRKVDVGGPSGSLSPARRITSPDDLVSAMHDRYVGKWYRNLTFAQKVTYLRPDGTTLRTETWYEAGAMPGRLRIDIADPSRGNGVVYRADSVYGVQDGRVAERHVGRNLLLVLGFDVYAQPAARTLAQLRAERIDVNMLRVDTLYGKRAYVVGAGPTDAISNQFWVEADRLLFVRLIQTDTVHRPPPQGDAVRTRDIRFENYVQHDGGWVAEKVRILTAGRTSFQEEYSNVRVNVPIDDDFFIPEKWSTAPHWFKP
jgi:hypothetical protein